MQPCSLANVGKGKIVWQSTATSQHLSATIATAAFGGDFSHIVKGTLE
jgi:hypothetical protein